MIGHNTWQMKKIHDRRIRARTLTITTIQYNWALASFSVSDDYENEDVTSIDKVHQARR